MARADYHDSNDGGVARVNLTALDLMALSIGAQGLGLKDGEWGFEVIARPGCGVELLLIAGDPPGSDVDCPVEHRPRTDRG